MRAVIGLTLTVVLGLGVASEAQARTRYCSESGDFCKATRIEKGKRVIALSTAALYGERRAYDLCVRDPKGKETCRTFKLRRGRYGIYSSKVTWSRHFPTDGGRGRDRIRWDHEGNTYGPPLHFRR